MDISKCIFIFSYNDASKINPVLRDRLYVFQTAGYTHLEKKVIAQSHLLPKIRAQFRMNASDVVVSDAVLDKLVREKAYTEEESGVRNLKRCLETMFSKLNLHRLLKKDNVEVRKSILAMDNIEFPVTLELKHLDALIEKKPEVHLSYFV